MTVIDLDDATRDIIVQALIDGVHTDLTVAYGYTVGHPQRDYLLRRAQDRLDVARQITERPEGWSHIARQIEARRHPTTTNPPTT